jgi:hypothetical protein
MHEFRRFFNTFIVVEGKRVFAIPKTTTEDYLKYRADYMEIVGSYSNRRVGLIGTKFQFVLLGLRYRSRVHKRDYFEFDDLEQMDSFLKGLGAPENYRAEIKEHEGDHIRQANNLGYGTTVGLWRTREQNGSPNIHPLIQAIGKINIPDYYRIAHAPKILSDSDSQTLN